MDFDKPFRKLELTLTVKVDSLGDHPGVSLPSLQALALESARDWRDGRHGFASEMILDGLDRLLKGAVYGAMLQYNQGLYQGQVVTETSADGRVTSTTPVAVIETGKSAHDVSLWANYVADLTIKEAEEVQ